MLSPSQARNEGLLRIFLLFALLILLQVFLHGSLFGLIEFAVAILVVLLQKFGMPGRFIFLRRAFIGSARNRTEAKADGNNHG